MPPWGLTEADRKLKPWNLHEALLAPCKVTTDEVWGDIYTTVLEQAIIDTGPMQRLRRVRQLGNSHLVYPGATHTRFSHSLGALRVVQDLLDGAINQREALHAAEDLLSQWQARFPDGAFHRRVAEALVLGRLGALLHDLCHVPYGHSIEDDLEVLESHDENGPRFEKLWAQISEELPAGVAHHLHQQDEDGPEEIILSLKELTAEDGRLSQQLRPLIISKDQHAKDMRKRKAFDYPFVEDLVGDTICADLLDYLLRDHLNTGLPASLGRRFTSAFFTVPEGRGPFSQRAALNIMRNSHERTDVVSELLKALRYRYELSERVLYHHAKLAADAMIGRALELWSDAVWLRAYAGQVAGLNEAETLLKAGNVPAMRAALLDTAPTPRAQKAKREEQQRVVRRSLESEFLAHGDDGLLERISNLGTEESVPEYAGALVRRLEKRASELAADILGRRLFEVAGRVGLQDAPAAELFELYGAAAQRRQLQEEAQRFAELGDKPQVLIWLPSPKMRIKLAAVLVDDGQHVNRFNAYEETRGRRGGDVYRADSQLWGLWVFTDRTMCADDREAVLVYLASRLGVAWESLRSRYGEESWRWLPAYGLTPLLNAGQPNEGKVMELIASASEVSARSGAPDELPRSRRNYRRALASLQPVKDHPDFTGL